MKEQQYIDVTNLAKLRIAGTVSRDTLAMNNEEKQYQRHVLLAISAWTDFLEFKTKGCIDPEPRDPPRNPNENQG